MANIRRKGLYKIDTAGAGDIEAIGVHIVISKIRWVGATTAGHECKITDAADNIFWDAFASGANYTESDDFSLRNTSKRAITGLRVPTLGSGVLYIYTD